MKLFNLDKWMDPAHCLPDTWFRWYVIVSGCIIGFTYLIFSFQLRYRLKVEMRRIVHKNFAASLSVVFMLCALIHVAHSLAYYDQYYKLLNLAYPFLVYYHFRLIYYSSASIKKMEKLKTMDEFNEIRRKKEQEIIEYAAKGIKVISDKKNT